jgi:anaerobic magnesium-protoporphyrin IX monomethyl ester cyclase
MLDLLLINPGGRNRIYQGLGSEFTAIEPPLWCRLIAGYCRDRGWSVDILDAAAYDADPAQVANFVEEKKPRLVALVVYGHQPSASTQQMAPAHDIAVALKGISLRRFLWTRCARNPLVSRATPKDQRRFINCCPH